MASGNHLAYSERQLRNKKFSQGLLWCADCKNFKPIKEFWRSKAQTNYGYRCYCKHCEKTNRRDKQRASEYAKERNGELKRTFADLAGGKCHRCGYDLSYAALDFHHIYPDKKNDVPGRVIYNNDPEATWIELDKCCLLCRNCHSSYEAGEWRAEFLKRDGLGWTVGDDLPLDDDRYNRKPKQVEETPVPTEYIRHEVEQLTLFEGKATYYV